MANLPAIPCCFHYTRLRGGEGAFESDSLSLNPSCSGHQDVTMSKWLVLPKS